MYRLQMAGGPLVYNFCIKGSQTGEAESWQHEVQVSLGLETSRLFSIWYPERYLSYLAMSRLGPLALPLLGQRGQLSTG